MSHDPKTFLKILQAVVFVDLFSVALVVPLFYQYATNVGADAKSFGMLGSVFSAAQLVGSPFMGYVSDKYGRKTALLVNFIGASGSYLVVPFAQSFWVLALARIPVGIVKQTMMISSAYAAQLTEVGTRSKAIAEMKSMVAMAFVIGPTVGGYLAAYDLKLPAIIASALLAADFMVVKIFLPDMDNTLHAPKREKKPFTRPSGVLIGVIATAILLEMGERLNRNSLPIILRDNLQLDTKAMGMVWSFSAAISTLMGQYGVSFITRRLGDHATVKWCIPVAAVAVGAWSMFPSLTTLVLAYGVYLAANFSSETCLVSILTHEVEEDQVGATLGMQDSLNSGIGVLAPITAAYLTTWDPSYPAAFACLFCMAASLITVVKDTITTLITGNMDLPLDISYGNDVFNNQAVLGALSSLQQKIKRLEQERDYYMDSAEKARQHIESFKAETEHLRDQERSQQAEKERLREEDMRRLKEDRPRIEMELHHVHDKVLHTERLLEAERTEFTSKFSEVTKAKERLQEENIKLTTRLQQFELQIASESKLRQETYEEREKAQGNIADLISLNECLFQRLQEAEKPVSANTKKTKPQKTTMSRRCRSSSVGHDRHTMNSSRRAKVSPKRGQSPQNFSLNIHDKLKKINQGEIPFVPAGKAVWGESFNQMARIQNGLDLNQKDPRRTTPPRRMVKVEPSPAVEEVYTRFAREYDSINKRYAEELDKMRTIGEVDTRAVERMKTLAEELQCKGEDMKTLYDHECKVQEQLSEIHRPHIRGLDKRTKTLELFEEMKRIHARASS